MTNYADIISKLEKVTGPDRELDAEIMYLEIERGSGISIERTPRLTETANTYTSSIDAALTLVPDGFKWKLGYSRYVPCVSEVQDYREPSEIRLIGRCDGECDSNHAIALCIAALRARQHIERHSR